MHTISKVSDEAIELLTQERLMRIESPHLIERYNRALKDLCDFTTELELFHIDCSGYSPEIAKECGDPDYLNVNGINKKFILVSVHQQNYPIVRAHFSTTIWIIKAFIRQNFNAIVALTARDALYGELENNIFKVQSLEDVLSIRHIDVLVDTHRELISTAHAYTEETKRLLALDEDAWIDPNTFKRLLSIAENLDVEQPSVLIPAITQFEQSIFYSKHCGGMYVFHPVSEAHKAVVIPLDQSREEELETLGVRVISATNPVEVYRFLTHEDLIEPLSGQALIDMRNRLKQKQRNVVLEQLFTIQNSEPRHVTDSYLKRYIEQNFSALPDDFHHLYELGRMLDLNKPVDENIGVFYTCKVAENDFAEHHAAVLNHLISYFTPHSHIRCFAYNRDLFRERLQHSKAAKQRMIMAFIEDNRDLIEELDRHTLG